MIGGRGRWSDFGYASLSSRPLAVDLGELAVELVEALAGRPKVKP